MDRLRSLHVALSGLAIALVGAAIADPLVESISNTGVFGRGFRDDNHQSVVAVLLAGGILALLLLGARLRFAFGEAMASRDWVLEAVRGFAQTAGSRRLATIFAAQIGIVFAMEWSEQWLCCGAPLHGLSWLGGPIAFSLALNFVVCLICWYGARHGSRALLVRVICAIFDVLDRLLAVLARNAGGGLLTRRSERAGRNFEFVAVRRVRGRAPPSLAAFA